jgi:hypothetical protein
MFSLSLRKRKLIILVATRNSAAVKAAWAQPKAEVREALSTDAAYQSLSGARLAVLDVEHLEVGSVSPEKLVDVLQHAGAVVCSGDEFAASPQTYVERALSALGALDSLPPRAITVTGYGGGVGKTTLSLDLAAFVADHLRLTAALVEISYGASPLRALVSPDLPDFYAVVTQGETPGAWRRATALPMEYRTARLLLCRSEVPQMLADLKQRHVLTVFDAAPTHPLFDLARSLSDLTLIVSDTRLDCIASAAQLAEDLRAGGNPRSVQIVFNRQKGLRDRALLAGFDGAVHLPEISNPARYEGRLARRVMPVVYPGWRG